jgi:hypothetical protein
MRKVLAMAMLSEDGRSMNICIVRLPQKLINRYK